MALSLGSRKFAAEERELSRVSLFLAEVEEPVCQCQGTGNSGDDHQGAYEKSNARKDNLK